MKLWFDILRDPKMGMLPDRQWRRVIELFLIAGQDGEDGLLPDISEIAWRLNRSTKTIITDLENIKKTGIVDQLADGRWIVTNFKKRNEPVDPAKRLKDFRVRDRYEECNANETQRYKKCNADETELKRECNDTGKLRCQEEQRNRRTELNHNNPPLPPIEFQAFAEVYESVTGSEPQVLNAEIEAVQTIIAAGGTPDDYRKALQGMEDKAYTISSMASALTWTLNDIEKRKRPVRENKVSKPKRSELDDILDGKPIFAEDK